MHQSYLYSSLPEKSGIYLFKNIKNKSIYIGKAKNLKKRVSSYFKKNNFSDPRLQLLVSEITSVDYILTNSEIEAFLLEANYIKKYKPFYNIKLSDDKSYPYIMITKNYVPYVTITRKKENSKATYFGPFPDAGSVKIVLKILRRIFPYQTIQNHPKRKCLYHHLDLCPCIPANPTEIINYKKNIKKIISFLKGDKVKVVKELEKERDNLTKQEEFENASVIQDKINRINIITSPSYDPFLYEKNQNLYYERINKELSSLKKLLIIYFNNLNNLERIECYDISNISGTSATGSMVVFTNGESNKKEYKRFRIRTKKTPDDYKMIQEVLTRRFNHPEWGSPNLIVIDGGKGQVNAAIEILKLKNIHIPIIGLAKREETIIIPDLNNKRIYFSEEKLSLSNPGLNLIRRIRDEAHRFALSYHKLLRRKLLLTKMG